MGPYGLQFSFCRNSFFFYRFVPFESSNMFRISWHHTTLSSRCTATSFLANLLVRELKNNLWNYFTTIAKDLEFFYLFFFTLPHDLDFFFKQHFFTLPQDLEFFEKKFLTMAQDLEFFFSQ